MAPSSSAYSISKFDLESVVEIMSSKTREERRTVEGGRQSSARSDTAEWCKERRGSKDDMMRRRSVVSDAAYSKKRHGDGKKDVYISRG